MASTICVRMKLSDFINTDNETEIMEMINKTHADLRITIFLHLWYENDEIDAIDLKDFLLRWEDKLHFRTKVNTTSKVSPGEFIFYDIVPKGNNDNKKYLADLEKSLRFASDKEFKALLKDAKAYKDCKKTKQIEVERPSPRLTIKSR